MVTLHLQPRKEETYRTKFFLFMFYPSLGPGFSGGYDLIKVHHYPIMCPGTAA